MTEKIIWLIYNYWFENLEDLFDTLQNWERKDKENNLFFENAIYCLEEIFELFDLHINKTKDDLN